MYLNICLILWLWSLVVSLAQTTPQPKVPFYAGTTFLATSPNTQPAGQIHQGVRAFIIEDDVFKALNVTAFSVVSEFLDSVENEVFVLIVQSEISETNLSNMLKSAGLEQHVMPVQHLRPEMSVLIKKNKRLLVFSKSATSFSYDCSGFGIVDYEYLKSNNKAIDAKLITTLLYRPLIGGFDLSSAEERILYPWLHLGHKPDFVVLEPHHVSMFGAMVDSMNRLQAYTGRINYKGEVLNEIRWIDHTGVMSNGIFSFPKNKSKYYELYTPWKEGYNFYPEVVKFDNNNMHQEFSAIKLLLEDELIYQFNFDKGVRNEVKKTLNEYELFFVNFQKEKGRGKVLCFDKEGAAIQFKRSPEFNTSKPFTISAWVNPDSINGIHTLVSKGLVFSLKIRYGGLSFAGTGFSSVIADSILVKQNDWQHISCVYVPGYHVQFFVNGQQVHDQAFDSLKVNDQALTIGNNFSSEAFSGKMDELMIWNRALSGEEIAMVYSQRNRLNSFPSSVGWLLLMTLLVLVLAYIVIRRKRLFHKAKYPEIINLQHFTKKVDIQSTICLFGDLFIPGVAGENLARQLTPRLKQLFVLLAIHPQGLNVSRLSNDLWPGVDEEKAKQSRNYAIQQLKKVLSGNPAIRLEYLSKNWILQFSNNIKVDVLLLEEIGEQLQHQLSIPLLDTYLSIAEKGKFLPGIDSECFDSIKAKVAETINSRAIEWAKNVSPTIAIRLGTILLIQDSLSEDGLKISIRALTASGRNGEAKDVYQTFAKRYKNTYNEDFFATFQSIS